MHVLLFDIDGTLIRSGGAGKEAIEAALTESFGVPPVEHEIPYGGRTDPIICHDLLVTHGLEPSSENIQKLVDEYQKRLPGALDRRGGRICEGVLELLARLERFEHIALGLLTGNVESGARIKLGHFGLWDRFDFGGYADRAFQRVEIAHRAIEAAKKHTGRDHEPERIWVIGDTPLDVQCARDVGAKAVAVATGWHTLEVLAESQPDYLLPTLAHVDELLQVWGVV